MQAQSLIANGYHIVPLKAGHKGPVIKSWQSREFTASEIDAGIGVKCGVGDYPICAIDIDVLDPVLAERFAQTCHGTYGMTVERVGKAPKTMLIYRAAETGWSKATSRWFSDSEWTQNDKGQWVTTGQTQRLEILGAGQQFVAYHIHPETGEPYEWVDMLGGLESVKAAELPVLTEQDVKDIVAGFEQMAVSKAELFIKPDSHSRASVKRKADPEDFTADMKVGISIDDAKELIKHLDASDYDRWLQVGMALHHEFDGSADALALYDDWSATAHNYSSSEDITKRWDSFGGGGITARTLIKWGNEANAKYERSIKHAVLDTYLSDIESSEDVFELADEVLTAIGKQLSKNDVVSIKAVRDAAKKKADSLGYPLTVKEIDSKLGVKRDRGQDELEAQTELTEFGNAKRMLDDHRDTIMFVAETESWYTWEGHYWRRASHTDIERLAKQTLSDMVKDFDSLGLMRKDEQFDFIRQSLNARMVSNMVKLIRSEDDVLINITEIDNNKMLFGVANGAIDLTTGKLLPADPHDRITIASDVDYIPTAKCPVFEQTLKDVFCDDVDMIDFFQRLVGYTMLGTPNEDIIVIPYGSGSNGKSTVLGAIRDVFADHAKTAANETFMGSKFGGGGGGPREDILRLMGSRFVYVSEPDENSALREGLVKAMTGGEAMPARAAYARATVEVMPTWTVFMPTNHKPIIKGDDHGIWRRILPIPFERNFDNDPDVVKDKDRGEKLAAEKTGILAWCVRGALEYQRIGLAIPDKIQAARDEYKADMDLLADWINDCCEIGPKQWAGSTEIWKSWEQYANERGELRYIPNARSLGKRLSSRGFTSFKNAHGYRGRGFNGIAVKSDFETVENAD